MGLDTMFADCEISGAVPVEPAPGLPRIFSMDPTNMVPMVRIPAPRLMPADLAPQDQARVLVEIYQACLSARGVSRKFKVMPDRVPKLARCAAALRAAKISPAAWCQFRFDCHKAAKLPGNPRIAAVWSVLGIENRGDWYESMRAKYERARAVMAPKHAELVLDWKLMFSSFDCPTVAVERAFPDDTFERRLQAAHADWRRCQAAVDEAAVRGGVARW